MTPPGSPLRVLAVTTGAIDRPRAGGEVRTHFLFRELALLGHQVDLHSLVARNHPLRAAEPVPGFRIMLRHCAWLDAALIADRLRLCPITQLPVWLARLGGWIRSLLAAGRYDVVQFEFPWFGRIHRAARPCAPVVYGSHNVESDYWSGHLTRFPLAETWRGRLRRNELAAAREASLTIAATDADAAWLAAEAPLPPERLCVIPNGYDARTIRPADPDERARLRRELGWEDRRVALFVASNTAPNREAAAFLIERLAPALPAASHLIAIAGGVGASLGPVPPNVRLLGRVDAVLPLLQAADVAPVPMQSGSGSSLKIVEACAAGLAVVATPFGMRGLDGLIPHVRLADLAAFPDAVAGAPRPAAPPPESALCPYAWQTAAQRLEQIFLSLRA